MVWNGMRQDKVESAVITENIRFLEKNCPPIHITQESVILLKKYKQVLAITKI